MLKLACGAAGGALGALVGVPVISVFIAPARMRTVAGAEGFVRVAELAAIPKNGSPVAVSVVVKAPRDAWAVLPPTEVGAVFLRRVGEGIVAFSTVCPHLGCRVDYDASAQRFACPCHDSTFALDGSVQGGPAPRGLDRLDTRVESGAVEVNMGGLA